MNDDQLQKHTLNLYPGDYRRLQELFPDLGAGKVIRRLVRNYIQSLDAKSGELPKTEVQL